MSIDGSENRKPPEDGAKDECGKVAGFLPNHVACRIFGPDSPGISNLQGERSEILKAQRQIVAESYFVPSISHPSRYDAKGTEHMVRFRGKIVEKHQHSDGWVPFLDASGLFNIQPALPTEYLRRLELQNELFGDRIEIVGLTKANRFVTTQPTLRGGEPSENEMRDVLVEGMWQRVPIHMQNLPSQLMGARRRGPDPCRCSKTELQKNRIRYSSHRSDSLRNQRRNAQAAQGLFLKAAREMRPRSADYFGMMVEPPKRKGRQGAQRGKGRSYLLFVIGYWVRK